MSDKELLEAIKRTVQAFVPDAEVILYGSRARGDAEPDSDWDLLVLTEEELNGKEQSALRRQLYELEWDTGNVLSPVIESRDLWESPRYRLTSLYESISKEGRAL